MDKFFHIWGAKKCLQTFIDIREGILFRLCPFFRLSTQCVIVDILGIVKFIDKIKINRISQLKDLNIKLY